MTNGESAAGGWSAERWHVVVALGLVLLIGGGVRFGLAARRGAWIDEVYRITWAKGFELSGGRYDVGYRGLEVNARPRALPEVLATVAKYDPPLTAILLNAWMRVSRRNDDFGLRIPFVVLGLCTIAATYTLGAALFGRRTGLLAAALLAVSPFHAYYAQEINNYSLTAFCVVVSSCFYFRWLRRARWLDGLGFALAAIAALLAHYYALIVIAAQALGVLAWHWGRWRGVARTALPFVTVAGVFSLYLPVLAGQMAYLLSMPSGDYGGLTHLGHSLLVAAIYPWLGELGARIPLWTQCLVAGVAASFLAAGLRAQRDLRLRRVLVVGAVAPVVTLAAAFLLRERNQLLWPRYGLFSTFAIYVPVAAACANLRSAKGPALAGVAMGIACLAAGLWFLFFGTYQRDWRAVATLIAQHGAPEDGILVHQPNLSYALGRYLRTANRFFGLHDGPTLGPDVEAAMDGVTSTWTVFAWNEGDPLREKVDRMLSCRYRYREDYPLYKITLARYQDGRGSGPTSTPTECGPDNGFVTDANGCLLEAPADELVLRGWIDLPSPAAIEAFVDGRGEGPVALLSGPPARAVGQPPGTATRQWFEKRLDLRHLPPGTIFRVGVQVRAADGTAQRARNEFTCIKREIAPMTPSEPAVLVGTVTAPVRRRRFRVGDSIQVHGWVFASRGVAALAYRIDGREAARSRRHGFARPDVALAFPAIDRRAATYSGFTDRVTTAGLAPGVHFLTVAVVHPDGSSTVFGERRRFQLIP